MVAGGTHIDHADVLRSGATGSVLDARVMAPSTLGTFLRAFTFGHVRQLDAVLAEALRRAWSLGAGPGSAQMVMDLDSTICEVCGKAKGGAGYGYTHVLGYHPLVATRSDTGEVLHARLRRVGADAGRGAVRFVEELVARVRRAGATGELIMRFDSGFWSNRTIAVLERLEVGFTMGVRMQKSVVSAISAIAESAWTPIEYTCDGEAEVAECDYKGRRLMIRRTRLIGRQAALWPQWRHFAFVTDLEGHRVTSTRSTVNTPGSNWPSGTSKRVRDSNTCPLGTSSPTRPGSCAPPWPMTSSAGPPCSGTSPRPSSSPWRAQCAPGSSRCRAASSAVRVAPRCAPAFSIRPWPDASRPPPLASSAARPAVAPASRGRRTADDGIRR